MRSYDCGTKVTNNLHSFTHISEYGHNNNKLPSARYIISVKESHGVNKKYNESDLNDLVFTIIIIVHWNKKNQHLIFLHNISSFT